MARIVITPASAEWVLLSAIYHHVLASSPSPERAKIDIGAAGKDGRLRLRADVHEHRARPDLQLRPGEPPPKIEPIITTEQPLPRDSFFVPWDWERNRPFRKDAATKSLFEYVNIVGHRDDALALWPSLDNADHRIAHLSPCKRSGGRRAGYNWSAIEQEAYRLMDHHGDFSGDDEEWNHQSCLVKALLQFCQHRFGVEPDESTFRKTNRIPQWLTTWRAQKKAQC